MNHALFNIQFNLLQFLSWAGASYAFALFNGKERTVGGALDKLFFYIKKGVWLPLKSYATMGAAISIGKDSVTVFDNNHRMFANIKSAATVDGKITLVADRCEGFAARLFDNRHVQISCHSLGLSLRQLNGEVLLR